MTKMTVRTALTELVAQGLLPPVDFEDLAKVWGITTDEQSFPWFINVLLGIGAWLAALFLLGSIFLNLKPGLITGSVLITMTLIISHLPNLPLFVKQLNLATNLASQVLFLVAIGDVMIHDTIEIAAIAFLLQIILFILYSDNILRFLAVIFAVAALQVILFQLHLEPGHYIIIFLIAGGASGCWLYESFCQGNILATVRRPLGYALIVLLLGLLIPSAMPMPKLDLVFKWWLVTAGLTGCLVWVEYQLLLTYGKKLNSRQAIFTLLGTFSVAILLYQAPGVIGAIIVLLLGFARNNRILLGMAIIVYRVFRRVLLLSTHYLTVKIVEFDSRWVNDTGFVQVATMVNTDRKITCDVF